MTDRQGTHRMLLAISVPGAFRTRSTAVESAMSASDSGLSSWVAVSESQSPMSTSPAAAAPDQRETQHEPPTDADAPQLAGPTAAAAPEAQP